ncbi:hypothetical protein Cgig2_017868 [Carnegiea gigantea]|uniref:X8 domain-containing protein n=1 Tax=Carnegiea gigantea TaxID=171969 RepID=A0A9Q1KXJ0_9CARY|nr:hypothetical protein Cgig2_017868 [Carnegiea gigantea]
MFTKLFQVEHVLQKTLDYACGAGADCNPIRPNGQCYNPNTVRNHCSYAVNSYFQRKGGVGATCDFAGTAIISATDPSAMGCAYPAGSGASGTRTGGPITTIPTVSPNTPTSTPVTPVSGTGAGTTPTLGNSPTTTPPYTTTPNTSNPTGVLGGAGTGLGPSGSSMDDNNQHKVKIEGSIVVAVAILGIICSWN